MGPVTGTMTLLEFQPPKKKKTKHNFNWNMAFVGRGVAAPFGNLLASMAPTTCAVTGTTIQRCHIPESWLQGRTCVT